MSIIKDIQNQTPGVRKLMFGLSVIATVAFVGRIWFESFKQDIYTALNPEEVVAEEYLAEESTNPLSMFSNSWNSLRALVIDAFGPAESVEVRNEIEYTQPVVEESYSPLPLSPER